MQRPVSAPIRRLGIAAGLTTAGLQVVYAIVLTGGLMALPAPDQPIHDPWFTAMELLILLIAPAMLALMAAVHAATATAWRAHSLAALVFMALMTGLTMAVHFSILTLSRQPGFADMAQVWSFSWPSVVYALDILAWDVFFALSVLFAARVVRGTGLARTTRMLLIVSGLLALAGLAGVVTGDMRLRNIGIIGYAGVFPVAAALIAVLFQRGALPARAA